MAGQIRFGCRRTNIREIVALLKIRGADHDSMRHPFSEIDRSRRRWKPDDPAAAKCRRSFARAANLNDRHIPYRPQSKSFYQHPRGHIRRAAQSADTDAFSSEVFHRFYRLLNYQFIRQRVDVTRGHHETGASDYRACNRTSRGVYDLNIAGNHACNAGCRTLYKNKFDVEPIFTVHATIQRRKPHHIRASAELYAIFTRSCAPPLEPRKAKLNNATAIA